MANQSVIVCLSTYPPRECGIATFSRDLVVAYNNLYLPGAEMLVVAMQAPGAKLRFPKNLLGVVEHNNPKSYLEVAKKLNRDKRVKLVSIQHEFGIFGGVWGEYVEIFLKELKKPAVITFHTILPEPQEIVLTRMSALANLASGFIVMTAKAKEILISDYHFSEDKITVIPHGIHPQLYISPEQGKINLGLPQTPIISTFGLLSKGKGIEYVINSLPVVINKFPTLKYLVIGKTHPEVKKSEGETYRQSLKDLVTSLNLGFHVEFIDQYFATPELLKYLQATDIYISSTQDPHQAVSGTLSYAEGAGRPVISTKFPQALQDITPDVGALVPFKDPGAFSSALLWLLADTAQLKSMGQNAYFKTRHMIWPNVAIACAKYFSRFAPELSTSSKNLPPIKLDHIQALTDKFGILQFAHLHIPDSRSGYTLDDNARALTVAIRYYKKFPGRKVLPLIKTYLNFIDSAKIEQGRFRNYFTIDQQANFPANTRDNMEDANARCLYALMVAAATSSLPVALREKAKKLYQPETRWEFLSPRSAAFYIKGLCSLRQTAKTREAITRHCDFLLFRYNQSRSDKWDWFEQVLTYSNALLPEALLLGYLTTGNIEYFTVGKKTLDFLISQTFVNGMYNAIGQDGWYKQGGKRAEYDQQPEDPAAMVQALKTMHKVSKEKKYLDLMHTAFNWFLGDNVLGQFVYDPVTGGCYDGLSQNRTNLNQGAESTLSYLLARLTL